MSEPILRIRNVVLAHDIGHFKNGPFEGLLDAAVIRQLVKNYPRNPKVPVFLWDHVEDLDERPPDGWIESLGLDAMGRLIGDVKLHGEAAVLVEGDRIRSDSIAWNPDAKDYQGRPIGALLKHVTLTNNPYIKDLPNIAASARKAGGEPMLVCLTALPAMEVDMPTKDEEIQKLKDENKALQDQITALKAKTPADADEEREQKIIELKAETLRKNDEIETLKEQLANAKADVDRESTLVENVNLKRKDFLRDVRAIVEYGLLKGTLLAAECDGYAGTGPLDFTATERWLKSSKFYDATVPNPEEAAFRIINHMALKTKPRVTVGARFSSGTPSPDNGTLTLNQEQKEGIRKLGIDPDMVALINDKTTYAERQALKAQKGS